MLQEVLGRGAVSSRVGAVCWDLAQCHSAQQDPVLPHHLPIPGLVLAEIPGPEEGFE